MGKKEKSLIKDAIREANQNLGKNIKEEDIVFTSFFNNCQNIYEQVYLPEKNTSCFIKWNKEDKTWNYVEEFVIDDIIYKPIIGEELQIGAVILPTKPMDYGSEEELDQEIINHIHTWLDVPEDYERMSLYNIKLSWVYQKFNTLNYTRALGDTGTGKSRFLFTLGHLHYKPMIVAGALTPAVIFRFINKWKGTLLIDEGDQQTSDESNAFIKIMNCGYEKGMPVSRCDRNEPNKIDFFDVFCPKVLTTRKRFDDKATESRCMTSIMVQTFRNEIPDILTREYFKTSGELRNKLLMWRFRNYDLIDPDAGLKVDMNRYEPRLRQVNRSFVSLFYRDEDLLKQFFTHLDKYQNTIIQERADSFEGLIVNVLAELIGNGNNTIIPSQISDSINNDPTFSLQYKVSSQKISKILTGMGLVFSRKKIDGTTKNALLFEKDKLESIFSRYIVEENTINNLRLRGYEVTRVTSVMKTTKFFKNTENDKKSAENEKCGSIRNERNLRNLVTLYNQQITPEDVIFHIERLGKGEMPIEQCLEDLSIDEKFIAQMLEKGQLFQHRAGWVKVL